MFDDAFSLNGMQESSGFCYPALESTVGNTPLVGCGGCRETPAVSFWENWEGNNPAGSVRIGRH